MGTCDANCVNCFWDFYVWLCRFWGLVTALGLWGIGVEAAYYGHYLGFVILSFAVLVTFLEVVFAINFCVLACVSDTSSCCMGVWRIILWLDDWKRGILYIIISIPCFIEPADVWMGIISGVMLVLCALFYIIKTFRNQRNDSPEKLSPNATYDRFNIFHNLDKDGKIRFDDLQDELQDDLEDNIMNPSDRQQVLSVADQSEILEL